MRGPRWAVRIILATREQWRYKCRIQAVAGNGAPAICCRISEIYPTLLTKRANLILAVLVLMVSLQAQYWRATSGWACEGRPCGASASACCCTKAVCGSDCSGSGEAKKPASGLNSLSASAACHCSKVASSPSPDHAPRHMFVAADSVATLAAPVTDCVAPPALLRSAHVSTRGPPAVDVQIGLPLFRGPPTS